VIDASFLPPIAGQRSLFLGTGAPNGGVPANPPIPWSGRFTVRVGVPSTATRLHLQARPVSPNSMGVAGTITVRAAAAGRLAYPAGVVWNGPLLRQPVPQLPGGELFLGELRNLELPLASGHGPEVILDVSVGWGPACGLLPPSAGLLVDEVRAD
jgi:hypothetical protein